MTNTRIDEVLWNTVTRVGEFCLDAFQSPQILDITEKGHLDFASETDFAAEQLAHQLLKDQLGDVTLVGEEFGGDKSGNYWLIDPIDGTHNFINGIPLWGVILGYIEDGVATHGAIALPSLGIAVSASVGKGITVQSDRKKQTTNSKVFCVGRCTHWPKEERLRVESVIEEAGYSTVCYGSSAVPLALTAIGALAGFVESETCLWDCVPGSLVCKEAGVYSMVKPSSINADRYMVYAGNRQLLRTIEALQNIF